MCPPDFDFATALPVVYIQTKLRSRANHKLHSKSNPPSSMTHFKLKAEKRLSNLFWESCKSHCFWQDWFVGSGVSDPAFSNQICLAKIKKAVGLVENCVWNHGLNTISGGMDLHGLRKGMRAPPNLMPFLYLYLQGSLRGNTDPKLSHPYSHLGFFVVLFSVCHQIPCTTMY